MLSKFTIAIILIFVQFIMLGVSQNSINKENRPKDTIKITGSAMVHHPYCGGAAPPPGMENGRLVPMQREVFYLVLADDSLKTPYKRFEIDDSGFFEIYVKPGKYNIFHEDKMLPFKEFYTIKSQNIPKNSENQDIKCYKDWYNRPNATINTEKDTIVDIVISERCFVGLNPCLFYNGPYPPK